MRIARSLSALLMLAAAGAGCYHATIETGLTPSMQTIERPWAHSFIGGLVPPPVVETAARCPNGVASVETQLSFLNMVAATITGWLYTPMAITVRCAAPNQSGAGAMLFVPGDAPTETAVRVFNEALETSKATEEAVLVQFK